MSVTKLLLFLVQRQECPETNKELASVRSELKDPEFVEEIQLRQTNSYPGIKFCNLRIQFDNKHYLLGPGHPRNHEWQGYDRDR